MRILLVSGHGPLRSALARHFDGLDTVQTVLEAEDTGNAVTILAGDPTIDVVVLQEAEVEEAWGSLLSRLHAAGPRARIIVFGRGNNAAAARHILASGADGYLPGTVTEAVMPHVLPLVAAGAAYVPREAGAGAPSAAPDPPAPPVVLSPRRRQVLEKLAAGRSNKQIAHDLDLAHGTVKMHVVALLRELNATNRTEAVARARAAGLLGT